MLNQPSVIKALDSKLDQFRAFHAEQERQQRAFAARLSFFNELDSRAILDLLHEAKVEWPGALPTPELEMAQDLAIPFNERWQNHQDARTWARQVLHERITLAVDGSQIVPSLDYAPMVGAIQIGWFINRHCTQASRDPGQLDGPDPRSNGDLGYTKALNFRVLAPDELRGEDDGDDESVATQTVNQVRFVAECDQLCALMADGLGADLDSDSAHVLAFFDGSFIISFAGKIREARADAYIRSIFTLLRASEAHRVPLIGFVDSSRSRDLVTLINVLRRDEEQLTINDGQLLQEYLTDWGDRTPLFVCARNDGLSSTDRASWYQDVLFCYMRLSRDRPPARIEMPRWIYAAGLADSVLDLVRAECVVGTGYPYAIETADALAVITQQDRRRFYAILQQYLRNEDLDLTQTRKSLSKHARR